MKSKKIISIFVLLTLLFMCCGVAFASDSIDDSSADDINKLSVKEDFNLDDNLDDDSDDWDDDSDFDDFDDWDDDSDYDSDFDDSDYDSDFDDWDDDSDYDSDFDDWDDDSDYDSDFDDWDDDSDFDDWDDDSDYDSDFDDWDDDSDYDDIAFVNDDDYDWDEYSDDWKLDSQYYDHFYDFAIAKSYVCKYYGAGAMGAVASPVYRDIGYHNTASSANSFNGTVENDVENDTVEEDVGCENSTMACYDGADSPKPTVCMVGIDYSQTINYDVSSPESNVNDYSVSKSIDYQENLNQTIEDKNTTKLDAGNVNAEPVADVDDNSILLLFVSLLFSIILIL